MGVCLKCKRDISEVSDGDLRSEYCEQADYCGMEGLTENQQLLVEGKLCEECYEDELE
jgi:hypothetical protein